MLKLFPPLPPFSLPDLRQRTGVLLLVGTFQVLLFLFTAIHTFYWGNRLIGLAVHVQSALPKQAQLHDRIESPVGAYFTGNEGHLLYHASSLGDYFLFYSAGEFGLADALFLFLISLYLHVAMSKLQPGHEFSAAISRVFTHIGLFACFMFVFGLGFNTYLSQLFIAKTHHLFSLATIRGGNPLYVTFGIVLLLCASFFQLGARLQQEADLTI